MVRSLIPLAVAVVVSTPLAAATDYRLFPRQMFDESAESSYETLSPTRPQPELALVAKFEDDAIANNQYVLAARFDPSDENKLYVAFDSSRLIKVVPVDGRVLWQKEIEGEINDFAMSANGKILAVATLKGGISILDGPSGDLITTARGICHGSCTAVSLTDDGRRLVVGDANGYVTLVATASGQVLWQRKLHDWPVKKLVTAFDSLANFLISSDLSRITIWNLDDDVRVKDFGKQTSATGLSDFWVSSLGLVKRKSHLLVGGYNEIMLVDIRDGQIVRQFNGTERSILMAQVSGDETSLLAVARDHLLYQWDLDTLALKSIGWIKSQMFSAFVHVTVSPSGRYVAVASIDPEIAIPPVMINRVRIYAAQ